MDFKQLLAKTKATKEFQKARSVKSEAVPDGKYHVTLKEYDFGVSESGTPRAVYKWQCTRGECKGRTLTQVFTLNEWKGKGRDGKPITISVQDKYQQMFRQLQICGIDTDVDPEEIEEQLDELIDDGTTVVVTATTRSGSDFQNIKISNIIKGSEGSEDDEEDDDDDDDVEEEDDDEEDDEEDEVYDDEEDEDEGDEDEDEEEEDDLQKGDTVAYKVGRGKATKWEVTSVNKTKQTVALKRARDGRVEKNVPWNEVER